MRPESSAGDAGDHSSDVDGTSIGLTLPVRESELFKHGATPPILNFLSDNPTINVSIRQLSKIVPLSERATREAVDALEANDLIQTFHEGNARRVHINRKRLDKPDDPVLSVPQTEYQTPVRVAHHYITDELDDVKGIILFGSVARGEADQQSDIDLWVLVGGDRMQQRHDANKLAARLAELRIPPTIGLADANNADFEHHWDEIKQRLEDDDQTWTSAQRYSFETLVETPQSILAQSDRVDVDQLFGEGITIQSTDTLDRVKMEILRDE